MVLDMTLASFPVNNETGTPGVYIGNLFVDNCEVAVRVLLMRTVTGLPRSMAQDAAYNLAAQLLGAVLNVQAGAPACSAVHSAIAAGQHLLEDVGFDGTGSYLGPASKGVKAVQRMVALTLARALDEYNNGTLC